MKRVLLAILVCAATFYGAGGAMAQTDAVLEQYRAYRAALDTGDLNAAETAAEAALAASEARDGDLGNTAVLAMNLALVRLQKEEGAEAVAPAQRAFALAEVRGEASGVDAALARLALRRAELAANGRRSAPALLDALQSVAERRGAASEVYPAAAELGLWAFHNEDYDTAQAAWSIAGSQGEEVGTFALGRAKVGEAASIIMAEAFHGRRISTGEAQQAALLVIEGRDLLGPLADIDAPDHGFTMAQLIYAESLAWRGALQTLSRRDGVDLSEELEAEGDAADGLTESMAPASDPRPRCMVTTRPDRDIRYPARAQGNIGSVIVRLHINEQGEVVEAGVVAGVGVQALMDAVAQVNDHWSAERREDSAPNCRMQMTVFRTVIFTFG